jgi:hypothetical protein
MPKTKPKPRFPKDYPVDPATLTAGRYGTKEMVEIEGAKKTFEYRLKAQGQAALTLARLYPDIISMDLAEEIAEKSFLRYINPGRIREITDSLKYVGQSKKIITLVADKFYNKKLWNMGVTKNG